MIISNKIHGEVHWCVMNVCTHLIMRSQLAKKSTPDQLFGERVLSRLLFLKNHQLLPAGYHIQFFVTSAYQSVQERNRMSMAL